MDEDPIETTSNLMSDVLGLMDTLNTSKAHPAYDYFAFSHIPKERFEELKKSFSKYDRNRRGVIKSQDLRYVLAQVGMKISDEKKLKKIISIADPNNKKEILFSKFLLLVEMLEAGSSNFDSDDDNDDRRKSFTLFRTSGTEFMDVSNLKNALSYLGLKASDEKIEELISKFQQDGKISYDTYCQLVENFDEKETMPVGEPVATMYISPKRLSEMKEIFSLFECERKDHITLADLPFVVKCLGVSPTDDEIREIVVTEELDGKTFVSKSKYFEIMEKQIKKYQLDQNTNKMSESEIQDLRDSFAVFDTDGDGTISIVELGNVMKSMGRTLPHRKLRELIAIADADGNGTIEFPELCSLMEQYTVRNTFLDEMKKAFRHFDRDKNGFISPEELKKALLRMKIRLSKVEFVLMVNRVDTDKDGQISFKEFIVMMISDKNI